MDVFGVVFRVPKNYVTLYIPNTKVRFLSHLNLLKNFELHLFDYFSDTYGAQNTKIVYNVIKCQHWHAHFLILRKKLIKETKNVSTFFSKITIFSTCQFSKRKKNSEILEFFENSIKFSNWIIIIFFFEIFFYLFKIPAIP